MQSLATCASCTNASSRQWPYWLEATQHAGVVRFAVMGPPLDIGEDARRLLWGHIETRQRSLAALVLNPDPELGAARAAETEVEVHERLAVSRAVRRKRMLDEQQQRAEQLHGDGGASLQSASPTLRASAPPLARPVRSNPPPPISAVRRLLSADAEARRKQLPPAADGFVKLGLELQCL